MADPVMYVVDLPTQTNRPRASNHAVSWSAGALLVVLTIALIGVGLYWLQWSSLKGITLGYPKPDVRITSAATGTTLVNSMLQFSAYSTGRTIKYTWDFGDGSGATGTTVSHAFTTNGSFTIRVTASDPLNQTSSTSTSVTIVPPPPKAYFTVYSIYYGYVTFDASSSSADPSTSIASYSWNFGDGYTDTTSSSAEYHQYYNYGTYQVTLVVTDATGQTSASYVGNVTI